MQLIKQNSLHALQAPEEESHEAMELSGQMLILLHLLKVLAGYARCLLGSCNAACFKAWHLLLQVMPAKISTTRCNHGLAGSLNSSSIETGIIKGRERMCVNDSKVYV